MDFLDKRKSSRVLVLKTGAIRLHHGMVPIDCAVLNMSATGACILVPSGVSLPLRFELIVDREPRGHRCRMMWREGGKIGVEFEAPAREVRP